MIQLSVAYLKSKELTKKEVILKEQIAEKTKRDQIV